MNALLCSPRRGATAAAAQRGVVLLFVLIALVIMMVAGVALVRSFNTTMFTSGNIAFKRDLQNQSERVVPRVQESFLTGMLSTAAGRAGDQSTINYSSRILDTNAQGIPLVLLAEDSVFQARWAAPDIMVDGQQVRLRYVVERLCNDTGNESTLGPTRCQLAPSRRVGGSGSHLGRVEDSTSSGGAGATAMNIVYRLSIRVDGPRSTQAFFQTNFTM